MIESILDCRMDKHTSRESRCVKSPQNISHNQSDDGISLADQSISPLEIVTYDKEFAGGPLRTSNWIHSFQHRVPFDYINKLPTTVLDSLYCRASMTMFDASLFSTLMTKLKLFLLKGGQLITVTIDWHSKPISNVTLFSD